MPLENRILTAGDGDELKGSDCNNLQDRSILSVVANGSQDAVPADFQGATTIYGEFTIAASTDKLLDDSRDWRYREILIFAVSMPNAANLPSGANHSPDNMLDKGWCSFNTKAGQAIGPPITIGWNAFLVTNDIYFYADNTNGYLYASNIDGFSPYYIYFMATLTGRIV